MVCRAARAEAARAVAAMVVEARVGVRAAAAREVAKAVAGTEVEAPAHFPEGRAAPRVERVAERAAVVRAVVMEAAARVAAMVAVATVAVKAAAARVAVKVVVVTVAATAVPSPQPFWSCTAEPTPKHDGAAGQRRVALICARRSLELHASGPLRDRTGGRSADAATAEATAEVLMYQNVEAWVAWNPR